MIVRKARLVAFSGDNLYGMLTGNVPAYHFIITLPPLKLRWLQHEWICLIASLLHVVDKEKAHPFEVSFLHIFLLAYIYNKLTT